MTSSELAKILASSVVVFVSTNVDDLVLLSVFFADPTIPPRSVVLGQLVGMAVLVAVSAAAGFAAVAVPAGFPSLLGVVPLGIGLYKAAVLLRERASRPEGEGSEDATRSPRATSGYLAVAAVTLANGADNLSVYIPIFAADRHVIGLYAASFAILTGVWCGVGFKLVENRALGHRLRRYGHVVLPIVLVVLGIHILMGAREIFHAHDVTIELPTSGRELSRTEGEELQRVADTAFRDVRAHLEGLPPRLTLIVRWGKDVIPETGENGAAAYPGHIGWTIDPDRDVLATIRRQLRPTLFHELHHLSRASRVQTVSLLDHVVAEGLATAFERDFAGVSVPWGEPPPDGLGWTREILAQPATASLDPWMIRHPDGRRWIGMRVGTFLVDRASRASGKSPASLVFASPAEIVRLATVE